MNKDVYIRLKITNFSKRRGKHNTAPTFKVIAEARQPF